MRILSWECEFLLLLVVINNSCPYLRLSQHLFLQISAPDVCPVSSTYHSSAQVHVPITEPQGDFDARAPGSSQHCGRCGLPLWSDAAGAVAYSTYTHTVYL